MYKTRLNSKAYKGDKVRHSEVVTPVYSVGQKQRETIPDQDRSLSAEHELC